MRDVFKIPFENVLGNIDRGVKVLMSGLDYERIVISGGPLLGIVAACLDFVVPYVRQRKQFGQPIGEFQLVQGKLADMYVSFSASRAYVYEVAPACERGETTRKDSAGAISSPRRKPTWMAGRQSKCSTAAAISTSMRQGGSSAMPSSMRSAPGLPRSAAC